MNLMAIAAVAIGGALGSLLRYLFSNSWNSIIPTLPLGTLASNLVGGYFVGVAVAFFTANPDLPPEWRLFIITGCMGGLTTFSSFSAEAVGLISSGHYGAALLHTSIHLLGSFAMTALGIASYRAFA
jgi:fluoride exporter